MTTRSTLLVAALLGAACADTGQGRAAIALFVAGTAASEPLVATGDVPVRIDRADLAFGPLYLCAGATAGDLCDTARLEWLDAVVVDTLNPVPAAAGELSGVTGTVRSWMYDLGISSQLTRSEPFVLGAAQQLGDASFVLEGRATVGAVELPFFAAVPIRQTDTTELGVPVVRKSTTDAFLHDVTGDEAALVVRFDPAAWVRSVDFRPYVADESCALAGATIACQGNTESTCDGAGASVSTRDCSELGQVCSPGQGCANALTLEPDGEAFRSLRNTLITAGRPLFEWEELP